MSSQSEWNPRDHFDLSPQQYHAGLDRLWNALAVNGPLDDDVFTQAAIAIRERDHLRTQLTLQKEVADNQTWWCVELRNALRVIRGLARGDKHLMHSDRCSAIENVIGSTETQNAKLSPTQ